MSIGQGARRRIRLGVGENVGRVGGGGAGVYRTGVEGTGVVGHGDGEDVLVFEVVEEAMEVGEGLAAAGEVGALGGAVSGDGE